MRFWRRLSLVLMVHATCAGALCDYLQVGCTPSIEPGLVVRLVDASTGEGIIHATVTATDGDYTEVLDPPPVIGAAYVGAYERPGTYTLTIEAQGYTGRTVETVVVDQDICHVRTVSRTIELTPAG